MQRCFGVSQFKCFNSFLIVPASPAGPTMIFRYPQRSFTSTNVFCVSVPSGFLHSTQNSTDLLLRVLGSSVLSCGQVWTSTTGHMLLVLEGLKHTESRQHQSKPVHQEWKPAENSKGFTLRPVLPDDNLLLSSHLSSFTEIRTKLGRCQVYFCV